MSDNMDIILDQEPISSEIILPVALDEKRLKLAELLSLGKRVKDIASAIDMSPAWVRDHKRDSEVISMVKELQSEALQAAKLCIQNSTVKAANRVDSLIDSNDERVALAASINTLDRVGLKAAEKKEEQINVTFAHLSKDEIRIQIEERLRALRGDD